MASKFIGNVDAENVIITRASGNVWLDMSTGTVGQGRIRAWASAGDPVLEFSDNAGDQHWAMGADDRDVGSFVIRWNGSSFFGTDWTANGSEHFQLLNSGNLGLGVVDPTYRLQVNGNIAANTDIRSRGMIRATGWYDAATQGSSYTGLGVEMGVSSGSPYIYSYNRDTSTSGPLTFGGSSFNFLNSVTAPTFIGNVNGTLDGLDSSQFVRSDVSDTMSAKLTVTGTGTTIGGSSLVGASLVVGSDANGIGIDNNELYSSGSELILGTLDGQDISFRFAGTQKAVITSAGNFTAVGDVTAYSDERLKENIEVIDGALDRVKQVRGVTFDRKIDGSRSTGVIAQELQKVLPEAVHEDSEGMLNVAYGNVVGMLIEAIKELEEKVARLEGDK